MMLQSNSFFGKKKNLKYLCYPKFFRFNFSDKNAKKG